MSAVQGLKASVGKNNQTGEARLIGFKFDTATVKKSIRDYLKNCGWKKAGCSVDLVVCAVGKKLKRRYAL